MQDDLETREFVGAYLKQFGLYTHHIDSYHQFLDVGVPRKLDATTITCKNKNETFEFKFKNVSYDKPQLMSLDGKSSRPAFPIDMYELNGTYEANVYVDVYCIRTKSNGEKETTMEPQVFICTFPVMLMSRLCNLEPFFRARNYAEIRKKKSSVHHTIPCFIVDGMKKVLISQEHQRPNYPFEFSDKKSPTYTQVRNVTGIHGTTVEVRLIPFNFAKLKTAIHHIYLRLPYIKDKVLIHLGILFKAFGVEHEHDMLEYIFTYSELESQDEKIEQALDIVMATLEITTHISVKDSIEYIGKNGRTKVEELNISDESYHYETITERAERILQNEVFPHIGKDVRAKTFYLGYLVRRTVLSFVNNTKKESRDHLKNKRFMGASLLLTTQFSNAFNQIKALIEKKKLTNVDIRTLFSKHAKSLSMAMKTCLKTSKWLKVANPDGISVTPDIINQMGLISVSRKSMANVSTEGSGGAKVIEMRRIDGSFDDALDPSETQEGKKVGINKNYAGAFFISREASVDILKIAIQDYYTEIANMHPMDIDMTKILINGNWIGSTNDWRKLLNQIRKLRRLNKLPFDVSFVYDIVLNEIRVCSDVGRIGRFCFVVNPLTEPPSLFITSDDLDMLRQGKKTFLDFVREGKLEFIDKEEEENCIIYVSPSDLKYASITFSELMPRDIRNRVKMGTIECDELISNGWAEKKEQIHDGLYQNMPTHVKLNPAMLFGPSCLYTPYSDRTQSPRISYGANMSKQAIGSWDIPIHYLGEKSVMWLAYPQKPLTSTFYTEMIGMNEIPAGQNAVVAVTVFNGYAQEDATVINKSAVERGLFKSFTTKFIEVEVESDMLICIPNEQLCGTTFKKHAIRLLDDDGIICPGERVHRDDFLVGVLRVNKAWTPESKTPKYINDSVIYKEILPGSIRSSTIKTGVNGKKIITVEVIQENKPEIGDKYASRHAQKGVTGLISPAEDMPFTTDGIIPDIIMNPYGFPSRMTLGKIIEVIVGKRLTASSYLHTIQLDKMFPDSSILERAEWSKASGHNQIDPSILDPQTGLGDATPYNKNFSYQKVMEELKKVGLNGFGNEYMINGETGQPMPSLIFSGPVFYGKLKHLAVYKVSVRSKGPVKKLTQQPTDSKDVKDNGKRCGEMERDAIQAQGASFMTRNCLHDSSDPYFIHVCDHCGLIAKSIGSSKFFCSSCKGEKCTKINIPYASKLCIQEFAAMGIGVRIQV